MWLYWSPSSCKSINIGFMNSSAPVLAVYVFNKYNFLFLDWVLYHYVMTFLVSFYFFWWWRIYFLMEVWPLGSLPFCQRLAEGWQRPAGSEIHSVGMGLGQEGLSVQPVFSQLAWYWHSVWSPSSKQEASPHAMLLGAEGGVKWAILPPLLSSMQLLTIAQIRHCGLSPSFWSSHEGDLVHE